MGWDGVERRKVNVSIPKRRMPDIAIEALKYVSASLITLACFTVILLTSNARTSITRQEVVDMIALNNSAIERRLKNVEDGLDGVHHEYSNILAELQGISQRVEKIAKHQPQVVWRKYIYPKGDK